MNSSTIRIGTRVFDVCFSPDENGWYAFDDKDCTKLYPTRKQVVDALLVMRFEPRKQVAS